MSKRNRVLHFGYMYEDFLSFIITSGINSYTNAATITSIVASDVSGNIIVIVSED